MATLRIFQGDVPVAEVDVPAGGLRLGTGAGADVRLDALGLRAAGSARVVPDGRGFALRVDGDPHAEAIPLAPGVRVALGSAAAGASGASGAHVELVDAGGPLIDLAALPPDDAPTPVAPPSAPASAAATRLHGLAQVLQTAEAGRGASEVLAAALDAAIGAVPAARGFAALVEPDGRTLRVAASKGLDARDPRAHVSRRVLDVVIGEGREVLTGDAPSEIPLSSVVTKGIRSICAVPIRGPAGVAGLLYLDAGTTLRAFGPDDLALLQVLAALVSRRLEEERRLEEAEEGRRALAGRLAAHEDASEEELAWDSPAMRRVRDEVERLARAFRGRSLPVLLSGETGTGKEVLARRLHARVDGGRGRFVAVNCAAIPRELAESELFGIEQGVATGVVRRLGKFQQADGGTLFLDEVGEMDPSVQGKVLRALESRRIQRVGGCSETPVDVRVISATNRPLAEAIESGAFREDLYWRLCGVELRMPPLRERREDVPALALGFLRRFAREYGVQVEGFTPAAMERLVAHSWPGNVRELRQRVGAVTILARGRWVDLDDLPSPLRDGAAGASPAAARGDEVLRPLADVERDHVRRVLDAVGGDLGRAADVLGIHRKTLRRRLRGDGSVDPPDDVEA